MVFACIQISPEILLDMFQERREVSYRVVRNGIPDDSKFYDIEQGEIWGSNGSITPYIKLWFTSESLPKEYNDQMLPAPEVEITHIPTVLGEFEL